MARAENLKGMRFGNLVVVERSGSNKQYRAMWLCKCDCGEEKRIASHDLKHGGTISCGCVGRIKRMENMKKGAANSRKIGSENRAKKLEEKKMKPKPRVMHRRLANIWNAMKSRCYNNNHVGYENYGGRGIMICKEWLEDYFEFEDWALSNGYDNDLTIDRIDNDGGYSPENCRWSTYEEQMNNRRDNNFVTINGETKTIAQWAREYDLAWSTIKQRVVTGKPDDEILARPEGETNE